MRLVVLAPACPDAPGLRGSPAPVSGSRRARPALRLVVAALAALLFLLGPRSVSAQEDPRAEAPPAAEEEAEPPLPHGIRGKVFEVGGLVGVVPWADKVGLEPCGWFGGMAGHRFQELAGRLHLGFRAHWEGCIGEQKITAARIDMILVDVAFLYGVKLVDWLMLYGVTGAGFMIADSTPSGGRPIPRTVFQVGGGATFALGPYLFLDAGVRVLVFENVQFGGFGGQTGGAWNPLIALSIGAQI